MPEVWQPNPCRVCRPPGPPVVGIGCEACDFTGYGRPQRLALRSTAQIIGYGGQAGAGKTMIACMAGALRFGSHPGFAHTIFRKTRPEHLQPGGIWEQLSEWIPKLFPGATANQQNLTWKLPAGGRLYCTYLERPSHRLRYQGGATPIVSFDESTHFDEGDPLYLMTRQRSAKGIPCQMYLPTNPGGPGHNWYFRWFGPWLDPKHALYPTPYGAKRYIRLEHDDKGNPFFRWLEGPCPTDPRVKSITFIGGSLADNPILTHNNPGYEGNLYAVDRVTSEQLRGNWLIRHTSGTTFSSECFQLQAFAGGRVPDNRVRRRVRFWDRAGTEGAGDFTAGVRMALLDTPEPRYVIEDVIAVQWSVDKISDLIWSVAGVGAAREKLLQKIGGLIQSIPVDPPGTVIGDEQPPADAGLERVVNLLRDARLYGLQARVLTMSERGSKYSDGTSIAPRMQPMAIDAQNGRIYLLPAPWNEAFKDEAQSFDGNKNGGGHDDRIDAATGAHQLLADFARNRRFTLGRDR